MNQVTVVYADHEHAIGILPRCIISYSRAEPNREYLASWIQHARQLAAAHQRFVSLTIVDSDAKPPSDQIRVEINEALRSMRDQLVAVGYVMEGRGFVAAAKRSAVAMIALLARFPFPMRAFGDAVEASVWLVGELGGKGAEKVGSKTIVAAVEVTRSALKDAD